jgi:hypothetical protein
MRGGTGTGSGGVHEDEELENVDDWGSEEIDEDDEDSMEDTRRKRREGSSRSISNGFVVVVDSITGVLVR